MDPEVALQELRWGLEDLHEIVFAKGDLGHYGFEELEDAVNNVQNHFNALDGWLRKGGAIPNEWGHR